MSYDFSDVDLSKIDMTEDEVLTESLKKKPDLIGPALMRNLRSTGKEKEVVSNSIYNYTTYHSSNQSTLSRYIVTSSSPTSYTTWVDYSNNDTTDTIIHHPSTSNEFDFTEMFDIRQYNVGYTWNDMETMNTIRYYLATNSWDTVRMLDSAESVSTILRRKANGEKNLVVDDYIITGILSKLGFSEEVESLKRRAKLGINSDKTRDILKDTDKLSMNVDYESMMWFRELLDRKQRRKYDSLRGYYDWESSRKRDIHDEIRASFYRRPTTGRFDRIEYDYEMEQIETRMRGSQ